MRRACEAIVTASPAPWDLLVLLATHSGLRAGELAGLRVRHFNPLKRSVTVSETSTATSSTTDPAGPTATRAIARWTSCPKTSWTGWPRRSSAGLQTPTCSAATASRTPTRSSPSGRAIREAIQPQPLLSAGLRPRGARPWAVRPVPRPAPLSRKRAVGRCLAHRLHRAAARPRRPDAAAANVRAPAGGPRRRSG